MNCLTLPELSNLKFLSAEQLQPPEGVPTGVATLDNFLLWRGVPKGDLSLFQGPPGTGATSLWIRLTQKAHENNRWVAWVNSSHQLLPTNLSHQKINLKKLLVVKEPQGNDQLFWILQELITSSLFEVIGCQLKEMFLKNHQLQKLKKLCRFHKVALVFLSHKVSKFVNPLFSLSIQFQRDFITIQRALHRPTPFSVAGSMIYENLVPQFKNASRKLLG